MNTIKIIILCLLIPLFIFTFFKIKKREEFEQKAILAHETRKVMEHLMVDLSQAREGTILDAPADGAWHQRIAFKSASQGSLEYRVQDGHLLRINNGEQSLIADDIGNVQIRRQSNVPDVVEVQIEAKKNVSLFSYLKMRIRP